MRKLRRGDTHVTEARGEVTTTKLKDATKQTEGMPHRGSHATLSGTLSQLSKPFKIKQSRLTTDYKTNNRLQDPQQTTRLTTDYKTPNRLQTNQPINQSTNQFNSIQVNSVQLKRTT